MSHAIVVKVDDVSSFKNGLVVKMVKQQKIEILVTDSTGWKEAGNNDYHRGRQRQHLI